MNLEIKHLAPYLPYGLNIWHISNETQYPLVVRNNTLSLRGGMNIDEVIEESHKPILRPLPNLTKEDIKEFYQVSNVDIELIDWNEWAEELCSFIKGETPYQLRQFQYLFSRHFDIFGLIPQGLAIDINTINQ